jgi:HAD superfamily hydrolase (TIGR01549 family)
MNKDLLFKFSKCRGVGFDLDGTIVDSKLDFSRMKEDLNFPKDEPILEHLDKIDDLELKRESLKIIHAHEKRGAEQSDLIDGVSELLDFLKNRRIPVGILTRNSQETALLSLKKFNLDFDVVLSRDTALAKPNPDGIKIMAKRWGIQADEMAFFGDSSFDIETARNAGALPVHYSVSEKSLGPDVLKFSCYRELLDPCLNL